ncbi:acyl-homoserine-lactone synthase (plasmid) [Sinorhizobium meliloti]|nr:acyl-homoserine-lactone synthase [Sinorhizobium meliloti]WQP29218.1 acyl-homoserine-lactone synthase [Sinorhizobium meliloti]
MITDVFPSLLPNGQLDAHSAIIESSRFCADTCAREGRGAGSVTRRERSECLLR